MECLLETMRIRLSIAQGNQYPGRLLKPGGPGGHPLPPDLVFSCCSFSPPEVFMPCRRKKSGYFQGSSSIDACSGSAIGPHVGRDGRRPAA